jgi:hypothetical protein
MKFLNFYPLILTCSFYSMESIQTNPINSVVKSRKRTRKLASLNEDISDDEYFEKLEDEI